MAVAKSNDSVVSSNDTTVWYGVVAKGSRRLGESEKVVDCPAGWRKPQPPPTLGSTITLISVLEARVDLLRSPLFGAI